MAMRRSICLLASRQNDISTVLGGPRLSQLQPHHARPQLGRVVTAEAQRAHDHHVVEMPSYVSAASQINVRRLLGASARVKEGPALPTLEL